LHIEPVDLAVPRRSLVQPYQPVVSEQLDEKPLRSVAIGPDAVHDNVSARLKLATKQSRGNVKATGIQTAAYHVSMYGYFFSVRGGVGGNRRMLVAIQLRVSAGSITSSRPPPADALMALEPS
jgi:hypothetical protein